MSTSGDPRDPAQPTGNLSDELPAELFEPEAGQPGAEAEAPARVSPHSREREAAQPKTPGPQKGGSSEPSPQKGTHSPARPAAGEKKSRTPDRGVPAAKSGLSGGAWASLIAGTVVLVLLLIFIIQNNTTTGFQYFGWHFELPLGVAMLLAAIAGVLVAGIIGTVRIFVLQRKLKRIERAVER